MKGFIVILEVIVVLIVLFIAFSVFFPKFSYKNRWNDAYIQLKGRDIILTLDRLGKLYNYSFNNNELNRFLFDPDKGVISIKRDNLISWSETEGTFKNNIVIACNCTNEQIEAWKGWIEQLRMNDRHIDATTFICWTNLEVINPCYYGDKKFDPDVLIIWGNPNQKTRRLNVYKNLLLDYLERGNGILEIMDFVESDAITTDTGQYKIFGIQWDNRNPTAWSNNFNPPPNANDIKYQPYKFFYHVPVPLASSGEFNFQGNSYSYNICNGKLCIDHDGDPDTPAQEVVPGNNFEINGYNFFLSYIDATKSRIGITFKPSYIFKNFLDGSKMVADNEKILLQRGGGDNRLAVVALNGSSNYRTAWITANFAADLNSVGDDHKSLFNSLLLWVSNKKAARVLAPAISVGFKTSYVDVEGYDMYEPYIFNLGIAYPY